MGKMITDRKLKPGMQLKGRYKQQEYLCNVEAGGEDKLAFVLEDGRGFKSPSSAASALMEGKAVNGWLFWSLAGQAPAAQAPRFEHKKSALTRVIYRMPNQKGVAEGKERWYCNGCKKAFVVDADAQPESCPGGHRSDAVQVSSPTAEA